MKKIFFLFFILLFTGVNAYETSKFLYEKTWEIAGEIGSEYKLNGTFLVNDSEQKISSLNLSEGELLTQGKNLVFRTQGTLKEQQHTITVSAVVETKYNAQIPYDPEIKNVKDPKNEMEKQAQQLIVFNSASKTLIKIVEWIHENIYYNVDFSHNNTVEEVFENKEGVCTAYSKLSREFLNYSMIETKTVSGYVEYSGWTPHAWIEAKIGDTWVSADPTYGNVGALSSDHIKTNINGIDSENDVLVGTKIEGFSSDVKITKYYSKELDPLVNYNYEIKDNKIAINLYNPSNKYVFVKFSFSIPEGWGETIEKILIMYPDEIIYEEHGVVPEQNISPGVSYSVPFKISVMGQEIEDSLLYEEEVEEKVELDNPCASAFLLFLVFAFFAKCHYDKISE